MAVHRTLLWQSLLLIMQVNIRFPVSLVGNILSYYTNLNTSLTVTPILYVEGILFSFKICLYSYDISEIWPNSKLSLRVESKPSLKDT